jgi:hypothetical protein
MVRAARLDRSLYKEVEADRRATGQAAAVVVLSGVAAGIGALAWGGLQAVTVGVVGAVGGWLIWALLTYAIGVKLFPSGRPAPTWASCFGRSACECAGGGAGVRAHPGREGRRVPGCRGLDADRDGRGGPPGAELSKTSRAVGVCALGWLIQAVVFVFLLRTQGIDPTQMGRAPIGTSTP